MNLTVGVNDDEAFGSDGAHAAAAERHDASCFKCSSGGDERVCVMADVDPFLNSKGTQTLSIRGSV